MTNNTNGNKAIPNLGKTGTMWRTLKYGSLCGQQEPSHSGSTGKAPKRDMETKGQLIINK